jgi:hypothetical protein
MRVIILLLSFFFCISFSNAQKKPAENQKRNRIEKIINSQWTFNYFPVETADKGYESPGFDDSKWPAISLPHTWTTYETTGELPAVTRNSAENYNSYWWLGWGWYRKHFSISKEYSGRKVFIEFKGVQKYCKVWLNGKYIGDNKGGTGSFCFDITGSLKPGADNVLAIAVNNPKDGNIKTPVPMGTFNAYSGICSDVTLVIKNKLYIPMQGSDSREGGTLITTPLVSEKEGVVRIQTWVKNDNTQKKNCTLQTSIADATGKIIQVIKTDAAINPGQLYKFDQTGKTIKNPHLWSAKDQYLYKVYTEVIDGKEVTDNYTNPSGLRFAAAGDPAAASAPNPVLNVLEEILIKNMSGNSAAAPQGIPAGKPSKILLTGSHQKIGADRGAVAVLTADIVDSKGDHIYGTTNTVKWNITGPATLIGPFVYESDINKHHQMIGAWYKDMPVSNIIRSTGKPGRIHVSVSASGLASGSFDIMAEEIKADNSVITEPVLADEGRIPVARITLSVKRLDEVPREIKLTYDEFNKSSSDLSGFTIAIRDYILMNNPSVDSASVEFKTLVALFASHLINNNGRLTADDYNYNVDHYNNCRLISGYINSTKLPQLFKEGLKEYYANAIINQGSEKDAGEEMNWLNWIPSGGTVVIVQNENTNTSLKGVIYTKQTGLNEIICAVYPKYLNFSEEAKERALLFISKMNPYVNVTTTGEQSMNGNKIANASYTAEKGKPILIPLLKFIAE